MVLFPEGISMFKSLIFFQAEDGIRDRSPSRGLGDVYKRQLKSGVTEKYKLFIVVESVEDAYRLATAYPEIKEINLGGMKVRENTRNISKAINITPDEEKMVKELVANGCEVEIRQVPNDKKVAALNVL